MVRRVEMEEELSTLQAQIALVEKTERIRDPGDRPAGGDHAGYPPSRLRPRDGLKRPLGADPRVQG